MSPVQILRRTFVCVGGVVRLDGRIIDFADVLVSCAGDARRGICSTSKAWVLWGGSTGHGGFDEFSRHPHAGVPHRHGCGGAGGEAAAVAAAGEGGRGEDSVGVSVEVFMVLYRTRFCIVLWRRS